MPKDCIIPSGFGARKQVLERQGQITFTYDTWDHTIYGPKVLQAPDGTFMLFYAGYIANYSTYRICLATSSSILGPWTKPNLGRVTFGGNTNNNILIDLPGYNLQFIDCTIDPLTGKYLLSLRADEAGSNMIYESTDGGINVPFTFVSGSVSYLGEHASLSYSPKHGKYRRWYRSGGPSYRSVGFLDSASLTGPWVDRGHRAEFTSTDEAVQFYDFTNFYYAGSMWACVNMFIQSTQILSPMRLYRSDDHGDTWTRSTDLLLRPAPGQWDYGLTTDGCPILVNGTWYYIYGGKTGLHNEATQITFGMATAIESP